MIDYDECRAIVGMLGKENRCTRRKPALVLLCPSEILHDLPRDRARAAAVGRQQLIA
jgi:hypothetical protein